MGNISSMARASTALDSYVAELGNEISYDKSLTSSRFLKTILARHANGPLVLKIFIKPDAAMSLRVIQRRLKNERDALFDLPSCNSYQAFVETEKAGYLIRQWIGSNLYDRVSTQPYLAPIEKKWIAFQLLIALRDARLRKVAHGDIKSENVLVTSDLTVLVTDFSSSFKPTFLPLDDPSDFSFFFDTSARRTCYIAPERFYESGSRLAEEKRAAAVAGKDYGEGWGKRDGRVTEDMDVFSCGCVLAEMWTDGRTVFNLSELYAYKEGTIGLDGILDNIEDHNVKAMIRQMLSRDPRDRPSFDHILSDYRGLIFPEYLYTFLREYVSSLTEVPENTGQGFLQSLATEPGNKIDRMSEEWESLSVHLESTSYDSDGPALLILNIVTSSIRNCLWPSSRLNGLHLFLRLMPFLQDEDKVDRIIPFAVELLSDDVAIVRAEACRTIVKVIDSVTSITLQNATFIPEYLLPNMRHLAIDSDVFVRSTYSKALVRLASAAMRMLELGQSMKLSHPASDSSITGDPDYDSMITDIQSIVEEQAITLLVDPASSVKRSMLSSIADLCLFFGRQKSSEAVLSHIMTYLNDRDWHLRLGFFDCIVGVGAFIGIRAIEEYVLPLMSQALADPEEAVVTAVIVSLTSLSSLGLLTRVKLWDICGTIRGFLVHPNAWIRQGTVGFIAAAARNLPPSDVWYMFYPAVRTMLQTDVLELDVESILAALVPPLSRASLQAARHAALHGSTPGLTDSLSTKSSGKSNKKAEVLTLKDRSIPLADQEKIRAMSDFLVKQARAAQARESVTQDSPPETALTASESISLTELGLTLQTVFISPRTVGVDAKSDLKRLRPLLADTTSARTSFVSRSNRAGENPLDEIRKRLASLEPPSRVPESVLSTPSMPAPEPSPSESTLSSTLDLTIMPRTSRKKADTKAAAAVAAVHTTAVGTTSIHDDPLTITSGRSTPTIGAQPMVPRDAIGPYASSYEGHDPGVKAFLEQIDLDNYRQPLLDFGPRIASGSRRRTRAKSTTSQGVTMIAHLTQHIGTITSIVTSPDHVFFATASEDSQILIWDSARLERHVSAKPRLAYKMDAPVSAMCRIENTHCLAAAAEDGQLHVLRVHVAHSAGSTKYGKIECVRTWRGDDSDGFVTHIAHIQDSSLLLVTSTSFLARLDIRTMEITTRLQHPLQFGAISAICPLQHYIVLGTMSGILSLWDLRFGLLIKSWPSSGSVQSMAIHPSKGGGKWIMVSCSRNKTDEPIVETHDLETCKVVEVYQVRNSKQAPVNSPRETSEEWRVPNKTELVSTLAQSDTPFGTGEWDEEKPSQVLALLAGQGMVGLPARDEDGLPVPSGNMGYLVTAGDDRIVRYWDLLRPNEGFVICGSAKEKEALFKQVTHTPAPAIYFTHPSSNRQPSDRHAVLTHRQPLRPHYDAICALGAVETSFSSCVITGDRSGLIKVWRLEGGPKT
ncbi:hypothetical protein TREMEDRAFT_44965 [Tremella mesenterica DSM 1558]|uniref:uncharacterized protein n=1 Tax=Tremella mesenterica (strain ATCC 24925 / CBS 8224 / DSM 1558 / NBRC 9311 / NRRL Y-6157 / RJB 2259-6 / UBC 559-6) TaxID=578456 RepID=UPI0003F48D2D|nr:uncharacterized protein TREMEDRAFT_44965 [Tremella mesenterica DSM 1558]EIW67963.1 hypothetical protein TREMEDRAFT_44965 [Tremella mesenterica DSM 1558]